MIKLLNLINKNYYASLSILGVFYYVFFVRGGGADFWDKFVLTITAIVAIIFYGFSKIAGKNSETKAIPMDFLTNLKVAVLLTISLAFIEYFILLIIFQKNPPVAVGIPYSIYSFTLNRFLPGIFYDIVFYLFGAYFIKMLAPKKN